jgi:cyclophilin family peptidyl-prolyl cis-trans isomerase
MAIRHSGWLVFGLIIVSLGLGCSRGGDSSAAKAANSTATSPSTTGSSSESAAADVLTPRHEPQNPVVTLRTSLGDLTLELDAQRAPRTVYNFMSYASSGHYDETIFHQVDAGYAALGGSFSADLVERPVRYPIHSEANNGLKNLRGTIAMARQPDSIDSATCQFIINLNDNPSLDHQGDEPEKFGYCVFGKLIGGSEVLDKLAQVKVRDTEQFQKMPVETVMVHSVYRVR